jgi:hypothetical protein
LPNGMKMLPEKYGVTTTAGWLILPGKNLLSRP